MSFLEEKKPDVLQDKEGRTMEERRNKDIEIEGTEE